MTIGASYAASNEKIELDTYKTIKTFDKKIVSIDEICVWYKKYDYTTTFKVNIKKVNQQKYKIQSVKCKYIYEEDIYENDYDYKTYNGKNKNFLTIKPPEGALLDSMTINYQTKSKVKKESIKFDGMASPSFEWKCYLDGVGKKSKITLKEEGYFAKKQNTLFVQYHKFIFKTTNKKYKIKEVELTYRGQDKATKTKTTILNGNGKTSFTKTMTGKLDKYHYPEIKITYL